MSTSIKILKENERYDVDGSSNARVIKASRSNNLYLLIEFISISKVFLKYVQYEDLIKLCMTEKLMYPMFNQYWMQ